MEKVRATSLFGWRYWQILHDLSIGSKKVMKFNFKINLTESRLHDV